MPGPPHRGGKAFRCSVQNTGCRSRHVSCPVQNRSEFPRPAPGFPDHRQRVGRRCPRRSGSNTGSFPRRMRKASGHLKRAVWASAIRPGTGRSRRRHAWKNRSRRSRRHKGPDSGTHELLPEPVPQSDCRQDSAAGRFRPQKRRTASRPYARCIPCCCRPAGAGRNRRPGQSTDGHIQRSGKSPEPQPPFPERKPFCRSRTVRP